MTLPIENVALFREKFEVEVNKRITPEQQIESIKFETEIAFSRISPKFMGIIKQMAPFGPANLNPVFRSNQVWDSGHIKIVGNNHLQMWLTQEDGRKGIKAIAFNMGQHFNKISEGHSFDICYSIEENHWDGKVFLQLNVKDIKFKE